ncbi:DUF4440 domain-containing protein [Kosakonia sp. BK9b]|uniref:DUF4440 domain-containing protein n=1 Tax=Kosakonia sp. TaxID=1916651 RepID=UPI00289A9609|nr:DUF4440 domain-containing protein [Kosakonia sp.]
MNPNITEVINAHIAIENWLSRGEGPLEPLLARFAPDFTMVTLSGACLDNATLADFFRAQCGVRPGLRIQVDCIEVLAEWQDGAVLRYQETHSLPSGGNVRWSTVVFRQEGDRRVWRHLQETAQAQ